MDEKSSNKEVLDLVFKIKNRLSGKISNLDFPIPQFIVVGKQSVGKSRLIESLAGETFNFVCGTLGSRRPTILEFRNSATKQWYIFDDSTQQWKPHSVQDVMTVVGKAHEGLGNDISEVPCKVKLESPDAVDLGIVDLPGFRAYSKDENAQRLANKIQDLATKFMRDPNNHMLCVEEAGDNAGLSTLAKCKELDPTYRRTYLIRNKLDKFYGDLTSENINKWVEGYGDLPANLERFALSLPHWGDGGAPPKPFGEMRKDCSDRDITTVRSKNISEKYLKQIGFAEFHKFTEVTTQKIFRAALAPMRKRLEGYKEESSGKLQRYQEGATAADEHNILHETRSCGITFAQSFNHLMEGALSSEKNRMNLEDELRAFHRFALTIKDDRGRRVLSDEQLTVGGKNLDAYISYLRDTVKIAGMDVELNGGAQFRRLINEVEVYIRFACLQSSFSEQDLIVAQGDGSFSQATVVKILQLSASTDMTNRTKYVGFRLNWFFKQQKEATLEFMNSLKGSPEEHMFSKLIWKKAQVISSDEKMKQRIFNSFDTAADANKDEFDKLWEDYMNAMFQSPFKLLKQSSAKPLGMRGEEDQDELAPTQDSTQARIAEEISHRDLASHNMDKMINAVATCAGRDKRQMSQQIIEDIFGRIRTVVADQMQLYSESFFLLPMLRRLEGEMSSMEMPDSEKRAYAHRQKMLKDLEQEEGAKVKDFDWCIDELTLFEGKVR